MSPPVESTILAFENFDNESKQRQIWCKRSRQVLWPTAHVIHVKKSYAAIYSIYWSVFPFLFFKEKGQRTKICSYKYYSFSAVVRPKFCSNTDFYVLFPKAHSTSTNDICCKSPHIVLKLAIKRPKKQFKTFIFFSWLMGDVFFV